MLKFRTFATFASLTVATLSLNATPMTINGNFTEYNAVVQNDLKISNAPSMPSPILVGGKYIGSGSPTGSIGQGIANWSMLTDLSAHLATLDATGTAQGKWGGIYFDLALNSSDPTLPLDVFHMDGSLFNSSTYFTFTKVHANATTIVNIYGENVTMKSAGWNFNGMDPSKLILNFVEAKHLNISNMVTGTILAPKAAVKITNGTLTGTIVSDSLHLSNVGMKNERFTGTLPSPEMATPEPSSWAMMLAGAALLAVGIRRQALNG